MPFDAFISYSHKDKITADAVCAGLESAGIRCWIAPRNIAPGTEWGEGIINGIERCRVMVLIFSANANRSPQIRREVERATSKEMPILPFRVQDIMPSSKLSYFIGNLHWLDAWTPPLAAHVERLTQAVKSLLQADSGSDDATTLEPPASPPALGHRLARQWIRLVAAALVVLASGFVWWIVDRQPRSQTERDQQVITLAETLRNRLGDGAFDDAERALARLTELAPSSGHTFYFAGELQRIMHPNRDLYRAIDWFARYVDDPRNAQILASNRLDGQFCYEVADGFCRHRTGWVMHLLANIFYRLSTDETAPAVNRADHLRAANQYLGQSLKFYPNGFPATAAAPGHAVDNAWSTRQLTALIHERLPKE